MSYRFVEPTVLLSLLKGSVKPVFLLGAGASKQSGVMLASELVEEIARWGYCNSKGIDVKDPRLTLSDWKTWLKHHSWYTEDYNDLYPKIVDELLRPQKFRREFFLNIIHPDIKASKGYEAIAELMHGGLLNTILTTNFDDCLHKATIQVKMPPYFNSIKTPFDLQKMFSYVPNVPQLIYLHGSVEHYTDQNLAEEILHLHKDLIKQITPILKDRPLVVIGYRGAEASVMNDLLLQNVSNTNAFHNGIYWCILKRESEKDQDLKNTLTPFVQELAEKVGRNFQFIKIDGFDELLTELLKQLKADEIDVRDILDLDTVKNDPKEIQPADLSDNQIISDLELATIRERIQTYSQRLRIKVYEEDWWLEEQMQRLRIATKVPDQKMQLTPSGILLFSARTQDLIPSAYITLKFIGEQEWLRKVTSFKSDNSLDDVDYSSGFIERTIRGNIWNQLNEIIDALTLVNKPFRLKGDLSENVYPYPTLALKEIIVNSLVHRNYRMNEPVTIEVYNTHISFLNPGGLVEEVKRQLSDESIEDVIKRGKRGIKGYRNPVLADLFYGSGAMDKEGSGLADVVKTVELNSGKVSFGQVNNNRCFLVTVYRRPEEVDELTRTATVLKINETTKLACNLLEVIGLPEKIYFAETTARTKRDIWSQFENQWIPPYLLYKEKLWSFFDLSERSNPLNKCIDLGTLESISLKEFEEISGDDRGLVKLLNDSIDQHFNSIGLRTDRKRLRAYFVKTIDGNPKEITYQGRLKKATRTVAKPRINPSTGKISYWEHKAIWFGFEKIGGIWYLLINPTYVFTVDGYKSLLQSKRVSILSTRKASRDYNMHVHNDFTFWAKYISGLNEGPFNLRYKKVSDQSPEVSIHPAEPKIILTAQLPTVTVNEVSITEAFVEPELADDLNEIEKELEEEIESLSNEQEEETER